MPRKVVLALSTLADMMKVLRSREGLTQEEAAKKMGISRSALSNYEAAIREPDLETLELIADFYNCNMDTLVGKGSVVYTENSRHITEADKEILSVFNSLDKNKQNQLLQYAKFLRLQ